MSHLLSFARTIRGRNIGSPAPSLSSFLADGDPTGRRSGNRISSTDVNFCPVLRQYYYYDVCVRDVKENLTTRSILDLASTIEGHEVGAEVCFGVPDPELGSNVVSVKLHRLLGDIHEFRYFPGILILSSSVQDKK